MFSAFWFEWFLTRKKNLPSRQYVGNWGKYLGWSLAAAAFLVVLALNSEATFAWYRSLAKEKDPEPWLGRMLVIQQFQNVTASQLKDLSNYLRKRSAEEEREVELYGNMTYRVPVQYFLEAEPILGYGLISKSDNDPEKLYFAMTSDKDGYEAIPADIRSKFNLVATHSFSYRLKLYELELKEVQPEFKKEKKTDNSSSGDKKPRPRRTERVRWENIFQNDQ